MVMPSPAATLAAPEVPESIPLSSPKLLERTFVVLSLFTSERQEWTVTEIGRATSLPVPTVYRIVCALHRHGFLSRHEISKRYRLGPAIMRLGRMAAMTVDLKTMSHPVLRRISMRTRETSLLTVLSESGTRAVCLDRVESREPLRLSVRPGHEIPLYAGASQKILLANLPVSDARRVLGEPLKPLCSHTITDPTGMEAELGLIRRRGWAASCEETNPGVWGLAVGLIDDYGYSVAAFGVAGPCERKPRALEPWLTVLSEGAAEVAWQLGLRVSLTVKASPPARAQPPPGLQRLMAPCTRTFRE
jgi:IclR family transcriptional regulator, KDG regulon repressor